MLDQVNPRNYIAGAKSNRPDDREDKKLIYWHLDSRVQSSRNGQTLTPVALFRPRTSFSYYGFSACKRLGQRTRSGGVLLVVEETNLLVTNQTSSVYHHGIVFTH
jgi:hypothetical protein